MLTVEPIQAFNDNYIWAIVQPQTHNALIIDPGCATSVLTFLKKHELSLVGILVTHHHADHIGGIPSLLMHNTCPVYGPDNPAIDTITHPLRAGHQLSIPDFDLTFTVLELPGHTLDHIAFYNDTWLFCGDTLFAGGCGRVFEGTMSQMYHSLLQLKALDPTLQVFCAHEYTQANLEFALTVEPNNADIQTRLNHVIKQRQNDEITLPSSLSLELKTNPFLRSDEQQFTLIRRQKDQF